MWALFYLTELFHPSGRRSQVIGAFVFEMGQKQGGIANKELALLCCQLAPASAAILRGA
jgi:hypothetical protein